MLAMKHLDIFTMMTFKYFLICFYICKNQKQKEKIKWVNISNVIMFAL